MALSVVSNYAANVAHRYLQKAGADASRSAVRLASGVRAPAASDDPSSVALGLRLRSEIASLKQGALNVGMAASMAQVADSAMAGIGDILLRMKTLAVQAASDQVDEGGRAIIHTEFAQLMSEIDRISGATAFGGKKLIDSTQRLVFGIGGPGNAADREIEITIPEASAGSLGLTSEYTYVSGTFDYNQALAGAQAAGGWLLTIETAAEGTAIANWLASTTGTNGNVWQAISDAAGEGVWRYTAGPNAGQEATYTNWAAGEPNNVGDEDHAWLFFQSGAPNHAQWADAQATNLFLQRGYVIEKTSSTTVSLATQSAAASAIDVVSGAISRLASMRATLGAGQNRIEVAGNFLASQLVDVESARSGLMDLDVASEMAAFVSSQILQEAGVSMLAQANRLPQGLLKLLQ